MSENPNLNKQFGCMNGIFQVFHRQQYPARPVSLSSDVEKSLPPGERKDHVGEINMGSDKETGRSRKKKKKDKHRVCSESSSRPSFSSSPRSSSFSSTEVSTTASQFDQPGEKQIREQQLNAGGPMIPFDIKELVKGSINREMRSRRQEMEARTSMLLLTESSRSCNEGRGMAVKFKERHRLSYDEREMRNNNGYKETPRLSLDSSRSSPPPPQEPVTEVSHRRSTSSVVAKLMGLEVNFETEHRKENPFCDSPRPPSRLEPIAIKKIAAAYNKAPMEPAPWKQMKAAPTVYGEIQKRVTQLEFKKAGKDLRALKQILEAMEKKTQQPVPAATSPAMKQKAALPPNANTRQTRKVTPRPGLYKGQHDSSKSSSPKTVRSKQALVVDSCSTAKSGVSPRMKPKKQRQLRPTTPKSEPGKIQGGQLGRQQTESVSPRRKPRTSLQQPDDRVSNASTSLRSDSLGSNVDIEEVTSKHRLERNCEFAELHTPKQKNHPDFGTRQDRPSLKVTVEQPSPVSVLDASSFDEEDSPSPVRKISLCFKEGDALLRSEESMWINNPTGVCRSSILLLPDEDANFKSVDHKYISEILLASGLLRDVVEYSKNQARLPINPGLFFFLEQNKASKEHRQQQQTNLTEKIRRKLMFDTVNEILAQRFTAEEGCTKKPRFTANPMEKKLEAEELLQTLCSEIDRLQENKSKCILEEEITWEDLQCEGMNLKEFEGEKPGMVLDIERMIFRDLVTEVCFC
ncbi:hypothetical protein N665_1611s0005 [Sinapis alba]|nr:hypothetical protein N665_1611s0005 [Sinapis alba]